MARTTEDKSSSFKSRKKYFPRRVTSFGNDDFGQLKKARQGCSSLVCQQDRFSTATCLTYISCEKESSSSALVACFASGDVMLLREKVSFHPRGSWVASLVRFRSCTTTGEESEQEAALPIHHVFPVTCSRILPVLLLIDVSGCAWRLALLGTAAVVGDATCDMCFTDPATRSIRSEKDPGGSVQFVMAAVHKTQASDVQLQQVLQHLHVTVLSCDN